ncbi:MAG: hypothetical protein ACK5QX_04225, partial [bacterium]
MNMHTASSHGVIYPEASIRVGEDLIDANAAKLLMMSRSVKLGPGVFYGLCRGEDAIVQTPTFQRLARLRQMGLAYVAFPGAQQTRFEHSIGTAYWSQRILSELRVSSASGEFREFEAQLEQMQSALAPGISLELMLRVMALTHDIGLLPLGHTLQLQLRLMPNQHTEATVRAYDLLIADLRGDSVALVHEERELLIQHVEASRDTLLDQAPSSEASAKALSFLRGIAIGPMGADLFDFAARDLAAIGFDPDLDLECALACVALAPVGNAPTLQFQVRPGDIDESAKRKALEALIRSRLLLATEGFLAPAKQAIDAVLERGLHLLRSQHTLTPELSANLVVLGDEEFLKEVVAALRILGSEAVPKARQLASALECRQMPTTIASIERAAFTEKELSALADSSFRHKVCERLEEDGWPIEGAMVFLIVPPLGMQSKSMRGMLNLGETRDRLDAAI